MTELREDRGIHRTEGRGQRKTKDGGLMTKEDKGERRKGRG